jgi:hypothetical protein
MLQALVGPSVRGWVRHRSCVGACVPASEFVNCFLYC